MVKIKSMTVFPVLLLCFLACAVCFAQTRDEKEDEILRAEKLKKKAPDYKLSARAGVFAGYDTNVNLGPARKGDIFQEALFSLYFMKPLPSHAQFILNYDLDYLKYNEITDATSLLNHLRLTAAKKLLEPLEAGAGYDLGVFSYPFDESADFLFHRGFIYLKHFLSKRLYHQLMAEYGLKDYADKMALAATLDTYQGDEREDIRKSLEHSIVSLLTRKLYLKFKTKFTLNDSNATYLRFYDYKSYEASPLLMYRLSKEVDLIGSFSYVRKEYIGREILRGEKKEKDDLYTANAGVRYSLNKNNLLSLFYTYRENTSNDSFQEYSESVITCGWQYNF